MKKLTIILSTILVLFISTTSKMNAQTTQDEYNYLTKGYKEQIEKGYDMKKGYTMTDLGNWGLNYGAQQRQCTFKGLVRQGQKQPCAILMIYQRTDIANGANWYICIPSNNSSDEMWQQTLAFINSNLKDNNPMLETFIWALMKFSSHMATK